MAELTFDEPTHEYRLDGAVIPSVSQIVQKAGLWGPGPGFKKMDPAIKGTRIHLATEYLDKGILDWSSVEGTGYVPFLSAWQDLLSDLGAKPIEIETRHWMTVEGLTFAGTVDRVLEFPDGSLQVCDIKTGRHYPKPYGVQINAYRLLVEDLLGREMAGCFCAHINDKGKYQIRAHDEPDWVERWRSICAEQAQ